MHRHLSILGRQELSSTFVPGTQIFQERSPLLAGKQTSLMHSEQSRTLDKNERTANCRSTLVSGEGRVPTLRVEVHLVSSSFRQPAPPPLLLALLLLLGRTRRDWDLRVFLLLVRNAIDSRRSRLGC